MQSYFETRDLSVGYEGNILIHDINIRLERGKILTLIGPNGAGKSTILKSITRQLQTIGGTVAVEGSSIAEWSPKALAQRMAVVLTDRIRPELMTCAQVVAMGRYPYTNLFGKLTPADTAAVESALDQVHALDLAQRDFMTLSDGQRQRILLARAICQEPEIIVLDEPTAYLDIRYKIELLDILRRMAQQSGVTIIMSLHEIDLAMKVSDTLLCVKGDTIQAVGAPEEILKEHTIEELYSIDSGSYNLLFGSVELTKPQGKPEVFVIGGGGKGIGWYRQLQKRQIPFGAGILFENDVEHQVARELSDYVITAPAFMPMTREHYQTAAELLLTCRQVVDAGAPVGELNRFNADLLALATEHGIPIYRGSPVQWDQTILH